MNGIPSYGRTGTTLPGSARITNRDGPTGNHLERSQQTGRIILSNDADFVGLHDESDHGGIVLYDDQNDSVDEFIRGIELIERFVPEEELRGRLIWLDEWLD